MTASDKPSFEGLGIVKRKIGRFQPYGFQWYSVASEMKRNC